MPLIRDRVIKYYNGKKSTTVELIFVEKQVIYVPKIIINDIINAKIFIMQFN